MRPNPLLPRTLADETAFPIDLLRIALTGEATGRVNATGRVIGQLDAARTVAQAWTSALPREDRDGTAKFYVGVLTSFLTGKSPHTVRSWSGTVCDFFDFVAHDRVKRGAPDLRLVAPHDLMQADVDGYVTMLSRGRDASPEMIVDPQEKLVAEWLYDAYQRNPARAFLEREIAEEMDAEKLSWRTQPPGKVLKGFQGKQTGLRAILSALVRKKVLVRSPTAKEAKAQRHGDGRKKYPYDKARYTRPSGMKPATVATQVQRLTALVNLWATFNDDASLDIQEEFRPRVLRKNPWLKPRKALFARMTKPSDDTARSLRRMYPDDLLALLSMLRKRATPKGRGVSIRNILAKRDELAVLFLTGTGLRVFEALQAKVENMAPAEGGALWTVSGIKRKLGGDPATVFVPRLVMETRDDLRAMIYEYVKKTTELFSAEWEKSKAEVQERSPDLADEELGRQIEMGMREFSNKHRKEDFFREQFGAYLNLKESGPLLPALGRWGNAMTKARATLQTESGTAVVVPWDENSIRDRLLLMAPKGNPLRQRLHPHAFRHLAVALAEAATPGAMAAMALAGHKDSRTTDLYRDTVSLRRAATLAIEERLREMLAVASGAPAPAPEPVESVFAPPPPVVEPGVVPPAARPEAPVAEVVPLRPELGVTKRRRLLAQPPTEQAAKVQQIAADLLSTPKAVQLPERQTVKESDVKADKSVPVPKAPEPKPKIVGLGTLVPGDALPKPKKKEAPIPKTGAEAAVWATPPSEWFLPAKSWKPPVAVKAEELKDLFEKGWVPGAPVVSQWGLSPTLTNALLWSGVRTLLPYRISAKQAETKIAWSMSNGGIEALDAKPAGGMRKNAAQVVKYERLVALPFVNFEDKTYLGELASKLIDAYDTVAVSDPGAAKSMVRWLSDIRAHAAYVTRRTAGAVTWLKPEEEFSPESWGSGADLARARSTVLRNHSADEVVRFLRTEGASTYGPIGRGMRATDMEKADLSRELRLMDQAEAIVEAQSTSPKKSAASEPRGLQKYKLPDWVVGTDDPIGDPTYGLSVQDTVALKKWLLGLGKLARDIVSFEKDATSCSPYWALVLSFASSEEDRTIVCPSDLESYRLRYASTFKVDPLVATRRAVRHLWEVRESLRKERLAEDVDQVWGVVWSWILPSSEETKAVVVEAVTEAAERGDPDIDDMRRVVDVWMNIAVLETAASDFASAFQQFKDLVTKQVESGEERSQEAVLEREKMEISIAEMLADQLLRKVDGYETITQVVAKTLNKSMGEDLAQRIVKLGENITNGEDFLNRVALATSEPGKSEWDPKGGPEVVRASRESLLRSRNLPEVLAQYTYEQLPAALYSYYVLLLAGSSLMKMGIAINIEAYRITGGESEAVGFSTVGSGDISGGKSKGGMLTAFKKDEKRSGVISGTAEKYEMAVLSVLDMEKSAGAKNRRAVVSAYEKIVVPKIPKGGNNREMASQSTAYIAAMREFLTLYGADFDADKRTEKAASRLAAKDASKGPGPKMTPNRALTPNLAPLRSSALMEPSLRLLPGIRINPIALILALYA